MNENNEQFRETPEEPSITQSEQNEADTECAKPKLRKTFSKKIIVSVVVSLFVFWIFSSDILFLARYGIDFNNTYDGQLSPEFGQYVYGNGSSAIPYRVDEDGFAKFFSIVDYDMGGLSKDYDSFQFTFYNKDYSKIKPGELNDLYGVVSFLEMDPNFAGRDIYKDFIFYIKNNELTLVKNTPSSIEYDYTNSSPHEFWYGEDGSWYFRTMDRLFFVVEGVATLVEIPKDEISKRNNATMVSDNEGSWYFGGYRFAYKIERAEALLVEGFVEIQSNHIRDINLYADQSGEWYATSQKQGDPNMIKTYKIIDTKARIVSGLKEVSRYVVLYSDGAGNWIAKSTRCFGFDCPGSLVSRFVDTIEYHYIIDIEAFKIKNMEGVALCKYRSFNLRDNIESPLVGEPKYSCESARSSD